MNYSDLKSIKDNTQLLPWKDRGKSFSEGIFIISKYTNSDFPSLFLENISTFHDEHLQIAYGDITEMLHNNLTEQDAKRLFELGWFIGDGVGVIDNYFKLIL